MYQQQVPQPRDERGWEGSESEYGIDHGNSLQQNNQLADAIARRLQTQAPPMSMNRSAQMMSAGQRLALAIVSVAILVPLSAIALGALGPVGLIALAVGGAIILGINYMFNKEHL